MTGISLMVSVKLHRLYISHLNLSGAFVATAGNVDNKRPLVWLHQHSGGLSAGGVVGGGAAAVGTLHAAARCLLHPLLAVVTLLSNI